MKRLTWLIAMIAGAAAAIAQDTTPAQKPVGAPGGGRMPFMVTFDEMDANKDGKLTLDEFRAAQEKMADQRFGRLDKNGDGAITKDELPPFMQREGSTNGPSFFSKLDKDGDGKISKEEFAGGGKEMVEQRFKMLDKDGDGVVTKEEFEAGRPQIGGRRGGLRGEAQPPTPPTEGAKKPTT